MTDEQTHQVDRWEKLRIVSQVIGWVLSPIAVALIGLWVSTAVKEKDTQTRYVELSLGILSQQPTAQTANMRKWAVQVINFYSDVKISEETRDELLREKLQTAPPAPSRHVLSSFQTARYKVEIPSDVENMWVFYQQKSKQSTDGCIRPPNADPISPKAVADRMGEFIKQASADADIALIFTAFSRERGWDAAASEIRVNGKALKPMAAYWCNGVQNYGYELVLR